MHRGRAARHNPDLSDSQPNYRSPAASGGVIASGRPQAPVSLATSKRRRDDGAVQFGAVNEFSGGDLMLLSAHMVIWMKLMTVNSTAVGEQTRHCGNRLWGCECFCMVLNNGKG